MQQITIYSPDSQFDIDDAILTAMLLSARPRHATPMMQFEVSLPAPPLASFRFPRFLPTFP